MRELIYLSERKLRQFQPDGSEKRSWIKRVRQVGAKAPLGFGEISVTLSEETVKARPDLAAVIEDLENSERHIRWYAEECVNAGDWIVFDARMNFATSRELDTPVLFFWEPNPAVKNGSTQLLLHGSAHHLVGAPPPEVQHPMSFFSGVSDFFRYLASVDFPPSRDKSSSGYSQAIEFTLQTLNWQLPPEAASWMAGYAKVSIVVQPDEHFNQTVVVASPLYVEQVWAPE